MWIVNSCRAHTAHTLTFFDSILLLFNRKKTFFSDHSSQASTMVWWSLQAVYFASQLKVPCIFTTIHFKRTKKVHFKTIKMNVRRWKKAKTKTKITTQRISYRHWCASIGASFFLFNFMVSNFQHSLCYAIFQRSNHDYSSLLPTFCCKQKTKANKQNKYFFFGVRFVCVVIVNLNLMCKHRFRIIKWNRFIKYIFLHFRLDIFTIWIEFFLFACILMLSLRKCKCFCVHIFV